MSRTWITVAMLLAWLATNVFGEEKLDVCPQSKEMAIKLKQLDDTSTLRKFTDIFNSLTGGIADGLSGIPVVGGAADGGKAIAKFGKEAVDIANREEQVPGKDVVNCMDYYAKLNDKKLNGIKKDLDELQKQGIKTKEELMAKIKENGKKTQQEIAILKEMTRDGFEQVEKNFRELKQNVAEINQILKDEVLPAISELHNLVAEKFAALSKQLESVVSEIEAYHTATDWRSKIVAPLNTLQITFVELLSRRFSRGAVKSMIDICADHKPLTIVEDIWSVAGPGCNGDYSNSMVQEREGVVPDTCMALIYARRANFSHAAIVHVYRVVTNSILRATLFHYACVGITYEDSDSIELQIGVLEKIVSQISNQLPKTICEIADMYWPKIAEDSIVPLIAKYPWNETARLNETAHLKTAMVAKTYPGGPAAQMYKLLNERYSLYRHQVFAAYTYVNEFSFSYTTKPPNQTLPVVLKSRDILEFPSKLKSCPWDNEEWDESIFCLARIFVSRYRYATQEDKDSVNKRKANFDKWLKRNTSCACPKFPPLNSSDVECCLRTEIYRGDDLSPQFVEQFNQYDGGLTKDDRYQNYVILQPVEEIKRDDINQIIDDSQG